MTSRFIIPRRLPDRSKLTFYFPNSGGSPSVVTLPFLENIKISEKRKARYQEYSLISRSSNLYSYLGANSRSLNLTFHLTLPHVEAEHAYLTGDASFLRTANSEYEKERFKNPSPAPDENKSQAVRLSRRFLELPGLQESAVQAINSLYASEVDAPDLVDHILERYKVTYDFIAPTGQIVYNPGGAYGQDPMAAPFLLGIEGQTLGDVTEPPLEDTRLRLIDLVIYWVNIIRSSVVNNAENPLNGPPIIRLQHGILYQNIPCICNNYTLTWDEQMGYELDTLLPRRLRITMALSELRSGDFGKYEANKIIAQDNLAGWEAVINTGSMDPGDLI